VIRPVTSIPLANSAAIYTISVCRDFSIRKITGKYKGDNHGSSNSDA
jgi:hypothetical protein